MVLTRPASHRKRRARCVLAGFLASLMAPVVASIVRPVSFTAGGWAFRFGIAARGDDLSAVPAGLSIRSEAWDSFRESGPLTRRVVALRCGPGAYQVEWLPVVRSRAGLTCLGMIDARVGVVNGAFQARALRFTRSGQLIVEDTGGVTQGPRGLRATGWRRSLWDTITGSLIRLDTPHDGRYYLGIWGVISQDRTLRAVSDFHALGIRVVDAATGRALRLLKPSVEQPMAFSPDGRYLVGGNGDLWSGGYHTEIWDVRTGAVLYRTGFCVSARFSPDGTLLALGSLDGVVRVLSVPDWGRHLAAGRSAQIWEVSSGALVLDHSYNGPRPVLSPDGKLLALAEGPIIGTWKLGPAGPGTGLLRRTDFVLDRTASMVFEWAVGVAYLAGAAGGLIWAGATLLGDGLRMVRLALKHERFSEADDYLPIRGRWLRYTCAAGLALLGFGVFALLVGMFLPAHW